MNKYEEHFNKMINGYLDFNSDVIKELVERATPKKLIKQNDGIKRCPNCNKYADDVINGFQFEYPHCKYCGQALDWSE